MCDEVHRASVCGNAQRARVKRRTDRQQNPHRQPGKRIEQCTSATAGTPAPSAATAAPVSIQSSTTTSAVQCSSTSLHSREAHANISLYFISIQYVEPIPTEAHVSHVRARRGRCRDP